METNRDFEANLLAVLKQVAAKVGTSAGGSADGAHTHAGLAPSGGTTGQALVKNSATNYDYSWQTVSGGGGGVTDGDKGDITVSSGGTVWTIDPNVVGNTDLSDMAVNTIKGRITAGTGDPEDLTAAQVRTVINVADGANNYSHPNHSGDVTSVGDGATTIANDAVTNAKAANMAVNTIKGRITAGTGDPEDLTAANVRTIINVADGANNYVHPNHSGDVTSVSDGATTIVANAVTNAKMAQVATATFKGRTTAGTGNPEDLTVAQAKTLLNLTGTNSGDQTITLTGDVTGSGTGSFAATIANDAVSNAKLANMATATFKGRATAGTGDPEDLTGTQATALLDLFTSALNGLVPASGGGTTNFLRADRTWAVPAGGGGSAVDILNPWLASTSYYNPGILGGSASATGNIGTGVIRASLMVLNRTMTFDRIWSSVATLAAGVTHRMGIYNSNSVGYPTTLVANSDVQAYDDSTAGTKEGTFASAITLGPGVYWLAAMASSTTTVLYRTWAANVPLPVAGNPANSNSVDFNYIQATQTFGAMPATFPAGATPQAASGTAVLKILLRIQ